MNNLIISKELINLIKITLPQFADNVEKDHSLPNLVEVTKNWHIGEANNRINAGFDDIYSKYLIDVK